tara:strand:- start:41670 stop:41882 length:213 start_codon:yes stop_codon:yes gene_type:complete
MATFVILTDTVKAKALYKCGKCDKEEKGQPFNVVRQGRTINGDDLLKYYNSNNMPFGWSFCDLFLCKECK